MPDGNFSYYQFWVTYIAGTFNGVMLMGLVFVVALMKPQTFLSRWSQKLFNLWWKYVVGTFMKIFGVSPTGVETKHE